MPAVLTLGTTRPIRTLRTGFLTGATATVCVVSPVSTGNTPVTSIRHIRSGAGRTVRVGGTSNTGIPRQIVPVNTRRAIARRGIAGLAWRLTEGADVSVPVVAVMTLHTLLVIDTNLAVLRTERAADSRIRVLLCEVPTLNTLITGLGVGTLRTVGITGDAGRPEDVFSIVTGRNAASSG